MDRNSEIKYSNFLIYTEQGMQYQKDYQPKVTQQIPSGVSARIQICVPSTNTYVPGTVLGVGNRVMNETDKVTILLNLKFYWKRKTK